MKVKDITLVFDLDEALIHSDFDSSILRNLRNKKPSTFNKLISDGKIFKSSTRRMDDSSCFVWAIKRPNLDHFLNWCNKNVGRLIIWSAGSKDYVESMVDYIFHNKQYPYKILTYNDIIHFEQSDSECIKPLQHLFETDDKIIPQTTLIVDDLKHNFIFTNKRNGIEIPRFGPDIDDVVSGEAFKDNCLENLREWLMNIEQIENLNDIRILNKSKIFNKKPTKNEEE